MYYPSLKEFKKLAKKGNLIPVHREIPADMDTPVSVFLKIKPHTHAFLLESVEGREKIARYSFLGSNPSLIFKSKGREIEIIEPAKKKALKFTAKNTPLDEIKKIMRRFKPVSVKGLPRFYGGLVGYIGYDMARFFEQIPDTNIDDLSLPDAVFMLTDTILIFDHVKHTIKIVTNVMLGEDSRKLSQGKLKRSYAQANKKIEALYRLIKNPVTGKQSKAARGKKPAIESNFKKEEFKSAVKQAKEYIRRGDIIQAVLSQRFKIKIKESPFDIYRNLRSLNPSPYMFFLKTKDAVLAGSSPEMLVRCENGIVQARPIAGTRRRGETEIEDRKLEEELIKDRKERAEHLMLVDLGRNDLGRICSPGSVEVNNFMTVERYSHVMHLVSEVKGILDKKYDVYDVLKACFPAGTVTGSPKIRAMEIIDELENIKRGPYAGCVGYFSFSHNMDTCITIRTVIIKDNTAYVQAGAGIVADSVPQREYFETINKAKALIEAISR